MGRLILKGKKILLGEPGSCGLSSGSIIIEDGIIKNIVKEEIDSETETIDFEENYVMPGFIDVHTHAAIGIDTSGCSEEDLFKLSKFYASKGVTAFLPTLTTLPKEQILSAVKNISSFAKKECLGAEAFGIHLEGPCISEKFRGAQSLEYIVDPKVRDFEDYIDASKGMIKLVTIAPERSGSMEVIKYLKESGVSVNIGHSDADFPTCIKAFDCGAGCITHFLNGMRAFHQHEPSIMGAVLYRDEICIEAICDGFHLVPDTVRVLNHVLGTKRIILITDSIIAAGWPDGQYETPCFSEPLIVKNGDTKLLYTQSRAGSTITLDKALKKFINFTGTALEDAVRCVTINPARHTKTENKKGSIELNKEASFTVLDSDLNVVSTIVKGKVVYRRENH